MRNVKLNLVLVFTLAMARVWAQGPENLLIVVNSNSPVSKAVGEYYREKRNIPASQVCTITVQATEAIERATYNNLIHNPIGKCLMQDAKQDRILYLVLTKGVPLIVKGTGGQNGDRASVDSELTTLYQELLGVKTSLIGK